MVIEPEWLVGPVAALGLALYIIRALWTGHQASDADVKAQRDAAVDRLDRWLRTFEKGAKGADRE